MPELAERHHLHDGSHGVRRPATDDAARHHVRYRLIQCARALLAQHPYDIAFGQDAFYPRARHDQDRTDLALRETLDGSGQTCSGLHALDVVALGVEDRAYCHWSPP